MNADAAQALYDAERKGVPQITGAVRDENDGRCAIGVLQEALGGYEARMVSEEHMEDPCPLCGQLPTRGAIGVNALVLIAHLNDDHRLTFSEIARKLGPDEV